MESPAEYTRTEMNRGDLVGGVFVKELSGFRLGYGEESWDGVPVTAGFTMWMSIRLLFGVQLHEWFNIFL